MDGTLVELSAKKYTIKLEAPIFVSEYEVFGIGAIYILRYAYRVEPERGTGPVKYRKKDGKRMWALNTSLGWKMLDLSLASVV